MSKPYHLDITEPDGDKKRIDFGTTGTALVSNGPDTEPSFQTILTSQASEELATTGDPVNVGDSDPPTEGNVLTITPSLAAIWQPNSIFYDGCTMTHIGAQTLSQAVTTNIDFNTTLRNPQGNFSGSTYTVPVDGTYMAMYRLRFVANASGLRSAILNFTYSYDATSLGFSFINTVEVFVAVATNTYVIRASQTSGGDLNIGTPTISIFRLGP